MVRSDLTHNHHAHDNLAPARLGAPPIPKEHGAWVIVYAPILIGVAASGRASAIPLILLITAVTGLYLARNVATLMLRRGRDAQLTAWLAIYAALALVGLTPLLASRCRGNLLAVGGIAAVVFCAHAALATARTAKRRDRSLAGEVLGAFGLTLTAPAAFVACGGRLDAGAWWLWALCAAFFGSGVVYVKMVLAGAVAGRRLAVTTGILPFPLRLRIGWTDLAYHAVLLAAAACEAIRLGGVPGALVAIAFTPVCVRALTGWLRLSGTLPPLRRVGLTESGFAVWFTSLFALAILTAGRI